MARITIKDLEAVAARINLTTGSPMSYAEPHRVGQAFHSNIGNYHIDRAYGGFMLARVCTTGGGISNVFGCGHIPARALYERMHAYLAGLDERGAA